MALVCAVVLLAGCNSPTSSTGTQGVPGPSVYLIDVTNGNARIESGGVDRLPNLDHPGVGDSTTPHSFRLVNATGASLTVGTATTTGWLRSRYTSGGSHYDTIQGTSTASEISLSGQATGSVAAGQSSNFTVTLQDLGYCFSNAFLETRRRFIIPLTDHSTTPGTNYDFVFEVYGVIVC